MAEHRSFNDAFIRALKLPGVQRLKHRGKWRLTAPGKPYKVAESAPRGNGRLMVRVLPTGVKEFYYRYRNGGVDKSISLGRYDWRGVDGKTLAEINDAADDARRLQRKTGDVKEHKKEVKRLAAIEKRKGTFRQLLNSYADSLKASGKMSAAEVGRIFRRYVTKPFPDLADRKADEIAAGDIQRILARMIRKGITRQVNITRSYLRAAFTYGIRSDHDPRTVAKEGVLFGLEYNPVANVPRIGEFERAGNRTLSAAELRAFWKGTEALPTVQRQALRFNLALACQRPTQLLRADWPAFSFTKGEETLLLRDTKGQSQARDHLLPLTAFALEQLAPLRKLNGLSDLPTPFTADQKRRMVITTLSVAVREVSDELNKEPHKVPSFQLRDLRRTSETMLQSLGVDKEVRAHLLSHGRSVGVQGRHYERFDFLNEKRAALEKWARHLEQIITGKSAEVVPITAGGRRPRERRPEKAK